MEHPTSGHTPVHMTSEDQTAFRRVMEFILQMGQEAQPWLPQGPWQSWANWSLAWSHEAALFSPQLCLRSAMWPLLRCHQGWISSEPGRNWISSETAPLTPIPRSLPKSALLIEWPTKVGAQGWHPPARSTFFVSPSQQKGDWQYV